MYDVCIVGAGPAGSTLARLIDPALRVLLVDRRDLSQPARGNTDRPCGGLLAPAAQQELARQGLGIPRHVMSGPQVFAVHARDLDTRAEQRYQRFYTNVDRPEFDRWLARLASDRVETAFGMRAIRIERGATDSLVRLETSRGGRASVRARLVVAADGAGSWIRRQVTCDRRLPARYAAIQVTCDSVGAEDSFGAYWCRTLTDFYGWSIPKGPDVLIGLAIPAGAAASSFDAFLGRLASEGVQFGAERARSSAPIWRPTSPASVGFGDDRVAFVGEAAGLLSPSSAEGISYALRSGAALAHALDGGLEGVASRYRRAAAPLVASVTTKLIKSAAVHGPTVRSALLRSGVGALPGSAPGLPQMADVLGI